MANIQSVNPLLCELHAHTNWSDGELSVRELVDLYGRHGFDVLCVTDHVHLPDDPWAHLGVPTERLPAYFAELEREAKRAHATYGLLLVPGLELTDNATDPDLAAHAVAIGLRTGVPLESGITRPARSRSTAGERAASGGSSTTSEASSTAGS